MELRHPPTSALTSSETRALKRLLVDRLPIERAGQDVQWEFVGPATTAPTPEVEKFVRFMNRDSTVTASIKRQSIVVETSAYDGWANFCELLMLVIAARNQVSSMIGIERIGLRYIDEVRVPAINEGEIEWNEWVDDSLLGPREDVAGDLSLAEWQGAAVYRESQPGRSLVLRYGPRHGFAIDPNGELRRLRPVEPGPFFLMDIDSFWMPVHGIPEYDPESVRAIFHDIHKPVRSLFERLITKRLRDEVLRKND